MADFERIIDYILPTDDRNELINEAVAFGPNGQTTNLTNFQFLETTTLQGINLQVPLKNSAEVGYFAMHTNYFEAAAQNISILLNTLPEERVVTAVGSNVKRLLFEPRTDEWEILLMQEIKSSIISYMPQLNITNLQIINNRSLGNPSQINILPMEEHTVEIELSFGFKVAPEIIQSRNIQINA